MTTRAHMQSNSSREQEALFRIVNVQILENANFNVDTLEKQWKGNVPCSDNALNHTESTLLILHYFFIYSDGAIVQFQLH